MMWGDAGPVPRQTVSRALSTAPAGESASPHVLGEGDTDLIVVWCLYNHCCALGASWVPGPGLHVLPVKCFLWHLQRICFASAVHESGLSGLSLGVGVQQRPQLVRGPGPGADLGRILGHVAPTHCVLFLLVPGRLTEPLKFSPLLGKGQVFSLLESSRQQDLIS